MKINDNGIIREMTPQEESDCLRNQEQHSQESKEDLLAQMQILMDKYKALEN